MEMKIPSSKVTPKKISGFLRRIFKPVADGAAQSMVDADIQRIAKHHQAFSLFSPTFKSWNR